MPPNSATAAIDDTTLRMRMAISLPEPVDLGAVPLRRSDGVAIAVEGSEHSCHTLRTRSVHCQTCAERRVSRPAATTREHPTVRREKNPAQSWRPSGVRGVCFARLPAIMREGLVCIGHAMCVVLLLHGIAFALRCGDDLGGELFRHRLLVAV